MTSELFGKHDRVYVATLIGVAVIYTLMVLENSLSTFTGIFPNKVGEISREFELDITPAGWVFGLIWSIIFTWQFCWLTYALLCLPRRIEDGKLFYKRHDMFGYPVILPFLVNSLAIMGWLPAWSYKQLWLAFVLILITVLALYVSVFFTLRQFSQSLTDELYDAGFGKDVVCVRIFLQNGLAFFATWLTLATNLNFAMVLTYSANLDMMTVTTVILFIILALVLAYSVLENVVFPRALLHQFAPWFVLNVALIGSLTKNWVSGAPTRNNIITLVIECIVVGLTVIKIATFVLYKTVLKSRVANASRI